MVREFISGIYRITCNVNKKVYIGRSIDIYRRWEQHLYRMVGGRLTASKRGLRDDLMEYGVENFTFEILERCEDVEKQKELEVKLINAHKSYMREFGYNRLGRKQIEDPNERRKHWD